MLKKLTDFTAAEITAKINEEILPRLQSALKELEFQKKLETSHRATRNVAYVLVPYEQSVQYFERLLTEYEIALEVVKLREAAYAERLSDILEVKSIARRAQNEALYARSLGDDARNWLADKGYAMSAACERNIKNMPYEFQRVYRDIVKESMRDCTTLEVRLTPAYTSVNFYGQWC